MCTILKENWLQETKTKWTSKEPIKAYKVMKISPSGINHIMFISTMAKNPVSYACAQSTLMLIQEDAFIWKHGENVSDRTATSLTEEEINRKAVHLGFHAFLNKSDADHECQQYNESQEFGGIKQKAGHIQCNGYAVVEVSIEPEDVICVGQWDHYDNIPCVVAIKVTADLCHAVIKSDKLDYKSFDYDIPKGIQDYKISKDIFDIYDNYISINNKKYEIKKSIR